MATLITNADGNLTGVSTFAASEVGTSALAMIRANTTTIATATSVTSPAFTVTSGKVIDGILLFLFLSSGTAGTGTFKVDLQKGGVSQASVTVNKSDLPDINAVPAAMFFKFTSTATGDGGANWTVVITTVSGTGTGVITYNRNSATTGDLTRALRTTTAATAAAADNLIITGEMTGAGTHNSRAVTLDSTAATAYGNGSVNSTTVYGGLLAIGAYGTLSYGTTASTNYVLRLAGDLIIYQYGTLNVGSSGSEIPRTSTAVLEFQPISADGDFGLRNQNGTLNLAGLSRTVSKNVVKTKLTSDVASSNVLTSGPTTTNGTNTGAGGIDATGLSLLASTFADTVTNATHSIAYTGPSINNTTQTAKVWLARGSGTNNRFVRLCVGNATVFSSVTNGFFVDIDLQLGTIGTVTAIGTGTATSASITAVGGGFVVKITGKAASTAVTPSVLVNACSASTTTSFAGTGNQCFLYEDLALVTAASIADTTYNVADDTGWLNGDTVCIAATTRTGAECESVILNANAGSSSFVTPEYPFGVGGGSYSSSSWASTHSGTTPTQAEVGLITRNVKIRSTSNTLMAYVYVTALASFTASWAEFYYIGAFGTANKRGIEIDAGATATVKSVTYCSIHDCDGDALYCNTNNPTSLNLTFSNNVIWNITSVAIWISGTLTSTDYVFDSNLVMKFSSTGVKLGDIGGTFTNNTIVGASASSVSLSMEENGSSSVAALGNFSGNVLHSASGHGLQLLGSYTAGTFESMIIYRCGQNGIIYNTVTSTIDIAYNNLTLFGCSSAHINMLSGDGITIKGNNIIAGDAAFPSVNGLSLGNSSLQVLDISGVDFSGTTSIFAPHTSSDFSSSATGAVVQGTINNCKFGATLTLNKTAWSEGSYIGFEKYNQTAGDHRMEMKYGQLKTDTIIFNTASPSMRMTPNNASSKLESAPKGKGILVAVASGGTVNIAVYVRKSKTADGAAYTGNQPRLIQRANPSLGQSVDVVLATYSASTGSWNQMSATSSTATDDGAWEFIVDCDGTAGWISIDDWAAA